MKKLGIILVTSKWGVDELVGRIEGVDFAGGVGLEGVPEWGMRVWNAVVCREDGVGLFHDEFFSGDYRDD